VWAKIGFQSLAGPADLDLGRVSFRIHLGHGRRENQVRRGSSQLGAVAFKIARIAVEIFMRRELCRINENADNHLLRGVSDLAHQRQMSFV
jgi:hypothetical protein